jgi:hypothetical protein
MNAPVAKIFTSFNLESITASPKSQCLLPCRLLAVGDEVEQHWYTACAKSGFSCPLGVKANVERAIFRFLRGFAELHRSYAHTIYINGKQHRPGHRKSHSHIHQGFLEFSLISWVATSFQVATVWKEKINANTARIFFLFTLLL